MDNNSTAPILQGMKAGQHQNWKDKCQSQNGIAVLFARMAIDKEGRPRHNTENGSTPVGFLGLPALRREQCDISKSQNFGITEMS
jgi:hypothetical protein